MIFLVNESVAGGIKTGNSLTQRG